MKTAYNYNTVTPSLNSPANVQCTGNSSLEFHNETGRSYKGIKQTSPDL